MEAYIRQKAAELGIDPDIAVRVAKSEGLRENTWQADGMLSYGREQSYGPFQLHNAPAGERPGMGNDFVNATGLDPADPSTWRQGVDFALTQAKRGGWSPWFGAKKVGVTGKMGIDGQPAPSAPSYPPRPTDTVAQPGGLLGPSEAILPSAVADVSPSQEGNALTGYSSRWEALGKTAEELAKMAEEDEQEFRWLTPGVVTTGQYKPVKLGGLLG